MKMLNKALLSSLSIALGLASFGAYAQEAEPQQEDTTKPRAVLFKVHDIKPVENTDGVVTHCDFLVTFYNRTTDSFRQAKVDMGWTDEVTERYVIDDEEKKEDKSADEDRIQDDIGQREVPCRLNIVHPFRNHIKNSVHDLIVKDENQKRNCSFPKLFFASSHLSSPSSFAL